jgi:hypothetical protein
MAALIAHLHHPLCRFSPGIAVSSPQIRSLVAVEAFAMAKANRALLFSQKATTSSKMALASQVRPPQLISTLRKR